MDITDSVYAEEEMNQILPFTDNMPLAVDLIAHLADYEGLSNVLTRWEAERTSLISVGYDRKSNLDVSIGLSLSSPRITPDSQQLLSLLSILPDGLSEAQLVQSNLPIPNILSCKAVLLATSLAYMDGNKRLRSLIPVREYIQKFLPPSRSLLQALVKHFHELLEIYKRFGGDILQPVVNQITLNLGNLQEVLQRGLYDSISDVSRAILCIISLNSFYKVTGRENYAALMYQIQPILQGLGDHELEIHFIVEVLRSYGLHSVLDPEQLIAQAMAHFEQVNNPLLECEFFPQAIFLQSDSGGYKQKFIMWQDRISSTLDWIQSGL
jgi:hypothetical protein